MGRRSDALTLYREIEQRLRRDLGVEPEAATREVLEAVRSGALPAHVGKTTEHRLPDQQKDDRTPTEGKPGIAVLPFDNIGGNATASRLADGITEDIITDLARFRGLDVIARNSAAVRSEERPVGKEGVNTCRSRWPPCP